MKPLTTHLQDIERALVQSHSAPSVDLKLRVAELILHARESRPGKWFGLFVILGWKEEWNEFTDISDAKQDIFAKKKKTVKKINIEVYDMKRDIVSTLDFDGAILIDAEGTVLHSGVMIEGLRPRIVAQAVHPGSFSDLSEQFGFTGKVHTRHLSAITASYIFQPTTVFTMSEETGDFHMFENGRIVYSAAYASI